MECCIRLWLIATFIFNRECGGSPLLQKIVKCGKVVVLILAQKQFDQLENHIQSAAVSKRIKNKREGKNALIIAVKFAVGVLTTLAIPVLLFAADKEISVHNALVLLWELVVEFVQTVFEWFA